MTHPAAKLSSMARAALAYAIELSWAVFPLHNPTHGACSCGRSGCESIGKHPRTEHGVKDATTNPNTITTWWTRWPSANIGVATGQASGLVVLDVDGEEGETALVSLCGNPPVPTSLTGKGRHLLFKWPGFAVANKVALAPKLDVRADGGYIVAPPSVHASGRRYAWDRAVGLGPRDIQPPPLPAAVLERLTRTTPERSAASIPEQEVIPAGQRNQTLTSWAGRLLAKGHTAAEALVALEGLNLRCQPPLSAVELRRIVESIASRQATKGALALVTDATDTDPVDGDAMASSQVATARSWSERDFSAAPQWGWNDLRNLAGPVIPGDLWVVGARTGNGKTTFLMNWVSWLAEAVEMPWLYVGMEMDAAMLRRKWAAFRCGLDEQAVLTNDWLNLPKGSRERIDADLAEQLTPGLRRVAHFAPARRVSLNDLKQWVGFAVDHGCRVVVVDHFHRMAFGGMNRLESMEETARGLKELAVENDVAIVAAAQVNRGDKRDPLSGYQPPPLEGLKSCGALEEESDVVLMLYRRLKQGTTRHDEDEVRRGLRPVEELAEQNTMGVMVRKHRRNGNAVDRSIRLVVDNGLLRQATDRAL